MPTFYRMFEQTRIVISVSVNTFSDILQPVSPR